MSLIDHNTYHFSYTSSLAYRYVNDPRLCCVAPAGVECSYQDIPHPLFTCRRTFLQNMAIRVSIWVLGVLALIGNGFVIFTRIRIEANTSVEKVQSTFITNLAVSDFLMGIYMLILAGMDINIGESYFWEGRAEEWRSSIPCQIAGFIALVSSEASVFLVTLISVDRFISILFLFSRRRFGVISSRIACFVVWVVSFLLGGAGTLLNYISPDAYSLSDVCVGLPLIRATSQIVTQEGLEFDASSGKNVPTSTVSKVATTSTWLFLHHRISRHQSGLPDGRSRLLHCHILLRTHNACAGGAEEGIF